MESSGYDFAFETKKSRIMSAISKVTSCTVCKQRADRDRQLRTEDTENKAVYSIYVGETSLTLRERMISVRGEGARGGIHLKEYERP